MVELVSAGQILRDYCSIDQAGQRKYLQTEFSRVNFYCLVQIMKWNIPDSQLPKSRFEGLIFKLFGKLLETKRFLIAKNVICLSITYLSSLEFKLSH